MFTFLGRRISLDLTATLLFRHRSAPVELLTRPADVGDWAREAGLIDISLDVGQEGLRRTRALREAIYALASATVHEEPHTESDVALLNTTASAPPLGLELTQDGLRRYGDLSQLHSALARDALELLGGNLTPRIRECAGSNCTRLYLDTSRNATRRWCGMDQCGSRTKSANYRRRRRQSAPSQPEST